MAALQPQNQQAAPQTSMINVAFSFLSINLSNLLWNSRQNTRIINKFHTHLKI
jgi:hypothetical protein